MSKFSNVVMLNSLVGMTKKDPKWPQIFYNRGYSAIWVEAHIPSRGEGKIGAVVADLVMASSVENHALVIESKSGKNIEKEQAEKYRIIKSIELVDDITLPTTDKDSFTHDVVYVGCEEHADGLKYDIEQQELPFPLIRICEQVIDLYHNQFLTESLNTSFKQGLRVDLNTAPSGYFNFDTDSEEIEIIPHVVAAINSFVSSDTLHFSEEELARHAFGSLWGCIATPSYKSQIIKRVKSIMMDMMKSGMKDYLRREQKKSGEVYYFILLGKVKSPVRSTRLKVFMRQLAKYVESVNKELERKAREGEQLTLFNADSLFSK